MFIAFQAEGCDGFWFEGPLGRGSKFNIASDRWYVNYYPEDRTPERDAIEERANAALAVLREEMVGV